MADMNRRQLLKRAGQATTGLGGAGVLSGTGAATHGWDGAYVNTRPYYNCEPDTWSEWEYTYDTRWIPWYADELLVMIHGWNNSHSDAVGSFEDVGHEMASEGYGGEFLGWSWKSNCDTCCANPWHDFNVAEDIAWWDGIRLAHFIIDWNNTNPDGNLRLISHSLGGRVLLSALHHLYYYYGVTDVQVTSTHLMAAAVPAEYAQDDNFETPMYYNVLQNYNYYNEDDETLLWYEASDSTTEYALGRSGDVYGSGCNYLDHDVTEMWYDEHGWSTWMDNCAYIVHADMANAYYWRSNSC